MTSDIGKHPKRRKKENINVTSGEMIDLGWFYVIFYQNFKLGKLIQNFSFPVGDSDRFWENS